ncbi:MAG: AAA family ATPase, partial [Proteobacteria bacterium]|nr:AAA family ATPase [Pseudomonadota bacterium]
PQLAIPSGFEEWLHHLLEKDPANRYQRCADAAWALLQMRDPIDSTATADIPLAAIETKIGRSGGKSSQSDEAERSTLIWGEVETLIRLPAMNSMAPTSEAPRPVDLPPMPISWQTPTPRRPNPQLMGTGLSLYDLRSPQMVNRDQERELLWMALRDVRREGCARVVLLLGGAGCGKSRLARWLTQRADELGSAIVLRASHSPNSSRRDGLPAMLARHLRVFGFPRDEVAAQLKTHLESGRIEQDEWASLTEFVAPASKPSSPIPVNTGPIVRSTPTERFALLRTQVKRACSSRPVIIWLDDVQWGREALDFTVSLLKTQQSNPLPVLVVMTARDDQLNGDEATTLDEIVDDSRTRTMSIQPLAQKYHRQLIQQLLALDETLVARIEARTAGNPMFAVQLVGDWVGRDLLLLGEGGFRLKEGVEGTLPDDLHDAWVGTVERLLDERPESDGIALELAALLGNDIDTDEWNIVCKRAGVGVSAGLMEAMFSQRLASSVLGSIYGWSFAHAMLRESLERRAKDHGRWQDHHRICAEVLAELKDDHDYRERRAMHLLSAGKGEEALELLLDCSRSYLRSGDHRSARSMLTLWETTTRSMGLEADDPRLGAGWVTWAHLCRMRRQFEDAENWAIKAEAQSRRIDADHTLYMALREQGLLWNIRGKPDEAWMFLQKALSVAEDSFNTLGIADTTSKMAWVRLNRGEIRHARSMFLRAVERFEECHQPEEAASCWMGLYEAARKTGDYVMARQWLEKAQACYDQQGSQWGVATVINNTADLARLEGDLDTAESGFRSALEKFRQLGLSHTSIARINLSLLMIARQDYEEARDELEEFLKQVSPRRRTIHVLVHCSLLPALAGVRDWVAWDHHSEQALSLLSITSYVDVDIAEVLEQAVKLAVSYHQFRRARPVLFACQEQWRALGRTERADELNGYLEAS